jgi:hypothetical protein
MSTRGEWFTIGQLAQRCGVPARTVRFWSVPGLHLARAMRRLPAELPDEPTAEQVDAWIELGELVADDGFRDRVRGMFIAGGTEDYQGGGGEAGGGSGIPVDAQAMEHAGRALAMGIAPGSAEGRAVLGQIVPAGTPAAGRARLLKQLETFTDARVGRYWYLLAVVNGRPPYRAAVPAFEWLIAALRAA